MPKSAQAPQSRRWEIDPRPSILDLRRSKMEDRKTNRRLRTGLRSRRRLMREIDFLPPWYSQFLRRRRTVFFQTWMTIGVAMGLGLWIFLAERNQRNAENVMDTLTGQVQQTSTQLQQMERLEMLRR